MGTGAGKNPQVGMPLSPTVEYAEKRSKKEGEPVVIDAPALVDLVHGTVRYRNDGDHIIKAGEELKTGYFYHARLEDYSEEHDFSESEDEDEDMKADVNPDNMRFCLKDTDTVEVLKKRAAVRLLVPSSNIHISYRDAELGDETIIGKQRTEEDGDFTRFSICLQAV
ncbi:uncharacterized protein LOC110989978 isoform X3 [Acanthaster planci]|uniref:Uncharacterized protein LOC110989978 isoform X3 n=1 Tax=Acanthaster planci TaxID=133434 RepID=A0A8B7ZXY8_ACAPL|nr:uncharacterized protein LOC110989978 isoform X3 [Acanthaster planci]